MFEYPIDLIAIRDEKIKMQGTVIKWWNVNFVDAVNPGETPAQAAPMEVAPAEAVTYSPDIEETHETAQEELTPEQLEAIERANEIFNRLEAEKAADDAEKAAEIAAAFAAQQEAEAGGNADSLYNAATNSYSGAYGTGPVDEDTAAQAANILAEKHDAMADLISSIQQG